MNAVRTVSLPMPLRDSPAYSPWGDAMRHLTRVLIGRLGGPPSHRAFMAMLNAFRASGGTAREGDLARCLEDCGAHFRLPELLASGTAFGFEWRHSLWIPMFQFDLHDLHDLSVKPGPQQVLAELGTEFDGWKLATWFGQLSCWLNGRRPVDLVDSNLPAVLHAARLDRFIELG